MFNLFRPKEIKATLKALQSSSDFLGQFSNFREVAAIVAKRIKNSEKAIVEAVRKGHSPEVIAISELANISGDFVESGQLCIYRGLLSPAGEDMLALHRASYKRLVDCGACTAEHAASEIAALLKNLKSVG